MAFNIQFSTGTERYWIPVPVLVSIAVGTGTGTGIDCKPCYMYVHVRYSAFRFNQYLVIGFITYTYRYLRIDLHVLYLPPKYTSYSLQTKL